MHDVSCTLIISMIVVFFVGQIVRDFGLASHTGKELVKLQRSFVLACISSVDDKSASEQALDAYVASGTCSRVELLHLIGDLISFVHISRLPEFTYHVSQALRTPYAKDDLACRLLSHRNYSVAAQVVAGSKQAEAEALSTHLFESKQYWPAACLNQNLSYRVGLTLDERCNHMLVALDALKHVQKGLQPGALGMQMALSGKVL